MLSSSYEDSTSLREYTSDFDESSMSIPRDTDDGGPRAIAHEMERMVVTALRLASVAAYREAMDASLPGFSKLLKAYLLLPNARVVSTATVIQEVQEYAGDEAAETIAHALTLFGRSARLASVCGKVPVDGEEDRLLARRWNRAYASITWSIMAVRVVESAHLMVSHEVAAQPFKDALTGARAAYAAARAAYDARYPAEPGEAEAS